MKNILTSILMAVGIAGPFVTHLAAAGASMSADIPFTFMAGRATMPAGRYEFSKVNPSGSVYQLRSNSGHGALLQLGVFEDRKTEKASVTFVCAGKECLLAKITPPGTGAAQSIGNSEVEKHLHHKVGVASMISIKLSAR